MPSEPNLARASRLPSSYYFDPEVRAKENRRVFGTTWQLAGRAEQVREAGQFFTTVVGAEPLLVVRGNDGVLAALSNVCRRRAGPLPQGSGERPVVECPSHGWAYALDRRIVITH